MKRSFLLFLLLSGISAYSQDTLQTEVAKNAFYWELGGNGGVITANYERNIFFRKNLRLKTRIGGFIIPPLYKDGRGFTWVIPFAVYADFFKGKHHLETGFGATLLNDFSRGYDVAFNGALGYRYQKPSGGLLIRAGYYPFFMNISGGGSVIYGHLPWPGLSVGWAF